MHISNDGTTIKEKSRKTENLSCEESLDGMYLEWKITDDKAIAEALDKQINKTSQEFYTIDGVKAKMPCSLYKIFCITNKIPCNEDIDPWHKQIKKLTGREYNGDSRMINSVIFGMYPELEEASKEYFRRYKDIYGEIKNNPNIDKNSLEKHVKELSFQIGEQFCLNENRYFFNEMTDEQLKRVQMRKNIELKNMCNESAESKIDPLNIIMHGTCEKN